MSYPKNLRGREIKRKRRVGIYGIGLRSVIRNITHFQFWLDTSWEVQDKVIARLHSQIDRYALIQRARANRHHAIALSKLLKKQLAAITE